jgi:hypothetical protein
MLRKYFFILALAALLLSACSAARLSGSTPNQAPAAPGNSGKSISDASSSGGNAYNSPLPEVKRIVIRNANLTLAVDSPADSMNRISALADQMGGFVVKANLFQTSDSSGAQVPEAQVTIRVAAERLDDALAAIRAESKKPVINETVESQDVTSDYTDLQSRLKNLQAAETQLQEIMGSATKTEDVLAVYNQLVQVRGEIETIQGKIKYYDQSAALSEISVDLKTNEAVQPLTVGGWEPAGVAKAAIQALINSGKFLLSAGIWIVLLVIPLLLITVLPIYGLVRLVKAILRRSRKAPLVTPPAAD